LTAVADKEAVEALKLMRELGVALPAATLYLHILQRGGVQERQLYNLTGMSPDNLRLALSYLSIFRLVSQDIVHDESVYFASNPRNAWKAHDTAFYWVRSLHVGDIDALPPLPEMEDEIRRQRYARLEQVCGALYGRAAKAHDPLRHRHRDIGSSVLFASWLAHVIASAQSSIVAVERPPRLPDIAPIWVALTRRIRSGVKYTRVVGVDEVVEHGLDIVDRDMHQYDIDLRLLPRDTLKDAFYIIDGKRLLLKNTRGDARGDCPPHFGVYTSQHQIVRRYLERYHSVYMALSKPASETVAFLRQMAASRGARLVTDGHHEEAKLFQTVVKYGKFAPPRPTPDPISDWLVDNQYLVRNEFGHLVISVPTD
jgi:hypothetical protein